MLPSHQNVKPSQTPFLFTSFQLVFFLSFRLVFRQSRVAFLASFWPRARLGDLKNECTTLAARLHLARLPLS